jgi:hypothetical protein
MAPYPADGSSTVCVFSIYAWPMSLIATAVDVSLIVILLRYVCV